MGGITAAPAAPSSNQLRDPVQHRPAPRKTLSQRDIEYINKIMNDIDNEEKSDVEGPGFEAEAERYSFKGKKRAFNTERAEGVKCKVRWNLFCRNILLMEYSDAGTTS